MMFALLLVVALQISALQSADLNCGPDEAVSRACPTTCDNPGFDCPALVLFMVIKEFCNCKLGTYRNAEGRCVLASECPPSSEVYQLWLGIQASDESLDESSDELLDVSQDDKCGPHEFLTKECPATCYETGANCPPAPILLKERFSICKCKLGTYRNPKGKCVPARKCPQYSRVYQFWRLRTQQSNKTSDEEDLSCGPDEVYEGTGRPASCDNKFSFSSRMEQKPYCKCKPGTYRDDGGKCVPARECPQGSEVFQHWLGTQASTDLNCGLDEVASVWCSTSCVHPGGFCPLIVVQPFCNCKWGTYRNKAGKCVPARKCPRSSVAYKIWIKNVLENNQIVFPE